MRSGLPLLSQYFLFNDIKAIVGINKLHAAVTSLYHKEQGAFIANAHVYRIEDGGNKQIDRDKVAFKHQIRSLWFIESRKNVRFDQLTVSSKLKLILEFHGGETCLALIMMN